MNRNLIIETIRDLAQIPAELPEELLADAQKLSSALQQMTDSEFAAATDGVVSKPAGEQMYHPEDPGYLVYKLYTDINEYIQQHREDGLPEELTSVANRLRGQIGTYERDFP